MVMRKVHYNQEKASVDLYHGDQILEITYI